MGDLLMTSKSAVTLSRAVLVGAALAMSAIGCYTGSTTSQTHGAGGSTGTTPSASGTGGSAATGTLPSATGGSDGTQTTATQPQSTPDAGAATADATPGTSDTVASTVDTAPDPFALSPRCTSQSTWTMGNEGSSSMRPGAACIGCHSSDPEAPRFTIAGTLYPTGHEPNDCAGTRGVAGTQIVVTDAKKAVVNLTPNASGNFFYRGAISFPIQVKVVSGTLERTMGLTPTTGDCNSCHTQSGATGAPGRIVVP
jgi:hypothetical protein